MKIVSITRLARRLSYWLGVAQKETVIVVRHGNPIVKIMPYKEENNDNAPVSR